MVEMWVAFLKWRGGTGGCLWVLSKGGDSNKRVSKGVRSVSGGSVGLFPS